MNRFVSIKTVYINVRIIILFLCAQWIMKQSRIELLSWNFIQYPDAAVGT